MASTVEVTVKTLDSQNHQFSVPEDMLVINFKMTIGPTINIPADHQRLIFRGRVLQDDKKISDYNVANNTIHVVQRPANASANRSNDEPQPVRNPSNNADGGQGGGNTIIMGTIGFPSMDPHGEHAIQNALGSVPRSNSAAIRLQVSNQMLGQASSILKQLEEDDTLARASMTEEPVATEVPTVQAQSARSENVSEDSSPMDLDSSDENTLNRIISQMENAVSAAALVATFSQVPGGNSGENNGTNSTTTTSSQGGPQPSVTFSGAPETVTSNRRPEAPRLREMALVVQELLAFQERFVPYLQYLQTTLQSNRLYENTEELQSTQYVFDTISLVMHYLSHSFHALSDIMCDFSLPPEVRRLRAAVSLLVEQSTVLRATIPFPSGMMTGNVPSNSSSGPTPSNLNTSGGNTSNVSTSPLNPTNLGESGPIQGSGQVPQSGTSLSGSQPLNFIGGGIPIGSGGFGQAQIQIGTGIGQFPLNLGGSGGQFQFNRPGQAAQINLGGTGQGGFIMPDLSALLGPNLAAGVMNAAAGLSQPRRPSAPNATSIPNQSSPLSAQSNTAATGNSTQPRPSANSNSGNNNIMNNISQQLQNEFSRRPFDILLSCHSHHGTGGTRRNDRPTNLRRFINIPGSSQQANYQSPSEDFLLSCIDLLYQSNILPLLKPILIDVITNYLMRGRDVTNSDHVRSCAKSMSKKIILFLESFSDKIQNRKENVNYSETYSMLTSNFLNKMIQITLQPSTNEDYRFLVLRGCEHYLWELLGTFKVCLSNDPNYLETFVTLVVDTVFVGCTSIFRQNATKNLSEYFLSLTNLQKDAVSLPPIKYRRETLRNEPTTSASLVSSTIAVAGLTESTSDVSKRTDGVLPPKQPRPSPSQNMIFNENMDDEEIDEMLTLNGYRRVPPTNDALRISQIDAAIRNIPREWTETVYQDLSRQLGMTEQPPFSPGYTALFSRKP